MIVVATSDFHGILPPPEKMPGGDVLIIVGDILPYWDHSFSHHKMWFQTTFLSWLNELPYKYKLFTAGNHDFYFDDEDEDIVQGQLKENCYFLIDKGVTIEGKVFYGTPWQRPFMNWRFNLPEEQLAEKYELIPENVDVLFSHGPAYTFCDSIAEEHHSWHTNTEGRWLGSRALLKRIEKIQPRWVLTGHIHTGDHIVREATFGNSLTRFACVSYLNEQYKPTFPPLVFEL